MKKKSILCISILLLLSLSLIPTSAEAEAANIPEAKDASEMQQAFTLNYTILEEKEKWILDEVVSDYVSEDIVELTDSGLSYSIGNWIDKDTLTCLFFDKELPEGTCYGAYGYTKTAEETYVYFELTSPEPLTEESVVLEIAKIFI